MYLTAEYNMKKHVEENSVTQNIMKFDSLKTILIGKPQEKKPKSACIMKNNK